MATTTKQMSAARAIAAALTLCRGSYQRAIVTGHARLSGADLKGKAKKYGAVYARSRKAILGRMTDARIPWHEKRGEHGLRILVVGKGA